MHLLIDGHNLIGQVPSISLADADDEAQLVMLLRRYATSKRGRQVVVVFDRGVYGHPQHLDGYGVTCHFAMSPHDADAQLIRRIGALRRPGDWTLVSSDRQVTRVARERGMRVIGAREFASRLLAPTALPAEAREEKRDVRLSEAEVAEWLQLFGEPSEQHGAASGPPPDAAPAGTEDEYHGANAKTGKHKRRRRS
jgi:predicted RNA-binding protein with PIN domain